MFHRSTWKCCETQQRPSLLITQGEQAIEPRPREMGRGTERQREREREREWVREREREREREWPTGRQRHRAYYRVAVGVTSTQLHRGVWMFPGHLAVFSSFGGGAPCSALEEPAGIAELAGQKRGRGALRGSHTYWRLSVGNYETQSLSIPPSMNERPKTHSKTTTTKT